MIDDLLLARLGRCRTVNIVLHAGRKGTGWYTTTIYAEDRTHYQRHFDKGHPPTARVKLVAENFAHVNFRQRKGETLDALIRRALDALKVRETEGMPKASPGVCARVGSETC